MIECQICHKYFMAITSTHLKLHNITPSVYKSMFPNVPLLDNSVQKKLSEHAYDEHKTIQNFGFQQGHKINEGLIPWNKGLTKDTDIRVEKNACKLREKSFSYEHRKALSNSKKQFYQEHPDKLPKGEKNGMFGKKLSEEHLKALWSHDYSKINKLESYVLKFLKDIGFEYTGNRKFWVTFKNGSHKCPDFVSAARKTVVEVYGDYWHRNDNPADIIKLYDEIGWRCIVYWEHEIHDPTHFNIDRILQDLGEWEMEEFTYEDWNGKWML